MGDSSFQLEGFGSDIKNTISLVLCSDASQLWIPYEFIGEEAATRIFLYGEASAGTRGLIASENWSLTFCMTGTVGTRTWSLLASMMPHMLKPCLLVISPDVSIPAAFIPHMTGTVIVFRWLSEINAGIRFSSVFFPIGIQAAQITVCQRAIWKGMALRTSDTNLSLVVQETRPQGLCLVSSILDEGIVTLSWYRMKDSDQLYIDERRNLLALWLGAISDRIIQIMRKE